GAGECLAVSAIAEQGLVRLDLGFKGNVSAVTTPVDFHRILRSAFIRDLRLLRATIKSRRAHTFTSGPGSTTYHIHQRMARCAPQQIYVLDFRDGSIAPFRPSGRRFRSSPTTGHLRC